MSAIVLMMLSQYAGVDMRNEGTSVGRARFLDCTGSGIDCYVDGGVGYVSVAGGAGGGSGGAPTTATYITQTPDSTLSAEQALSGLASGVMLNTTTTGVVTIYTGTSCTNQFMRQLSASGLATCASVALAADVSGTLPQGNGGTGAGALTCSSGQALSSNGSAYSCTSTLTASDVACAGACIADAEIAAVATTKLTGTVTDAQLASSYSGVGACSANQFANSLNDNASPTCAQVNYSNLAGSVPAYATVQDEGSALTQRAAINFTGTGVSCVDNSGSGRTDCTISGGGGGGSANTVAVTVDFGAGDTTASTVVTSQAWVTSSSIIACAPTLLAATGRAEGAEDAIIEGLTVAVSNRVAGVGFTVKAAVAQGQTQGAYVIHCTGA